MGRLHVHQSERSNDEFSGPSLTVQIPSKRALLTEFSRLYPLHFDNWLGPGMEGRNISRTSPQKEGRTQGFHLSPSWSRGEEHNSGKAEGGVDVGGHGLGLSAMLKASPKSISPTSNSSVNSRSLTAAEVFSDCRFHALLSC